MTPESSPPRAISASTRILVALFAASIVLTLILIVLSFPVGVYTVFFTKLSTTYTPSSPEGVFYFVGPIAEVLPFTTTLGAFFLALLGIYAALIGLAALQGRSIVSAFRAAYFEGFGAFFSNRLLTTITSIGFLVFTATLFDYFESSAGVPVGSLSGDTLRIFVEATAAPLREELGFRVVIIGVLAVIACVGRSWRVAAKSLWRPAAAYEGRESDSATRLLLLAGLIISSAVFGLAHSGGGYEIGKIPEAMYGGLVLGYVYVVYGFHVAVLVHWGLDYLGSVFSLFSQGTSGSSGLASIANALAYLAYYDLWLLIGAGGFLVVLYLGLKRFKVLTHSKGET